MTDVLWSFAKRNTWPGSLKIAQSMLSKFKTQGDLDAYVAKHFHPAKVLTSVPSWVTKAMLPELGNKAKLLAQDPAVAKVLLQAGAEHWAADKIQAQLEATPWWQAHPDNYKKWLLGSKADQDQLRFDAATQMSDDWLKLYGEYKPPTDFLKQADPLASGMVTQNQWLAQQRATEQYKERYPGNALRAAQGLPYLDEAQYRSQEDSLRRVAQTYGVDPKLLQDPMYLAQAIGNNVDSSTLDRRMADFKQLAQVDGEFVRNAFSQYAGVNNLSNTDLYHLTVGMRKDLEDRYNASTQAPESLADVEMNLKKAQDLNKAEYQAGGGEVVDTSKTSPIQRQEAF